MKNLTYSLIALTACAANYSLQAQLWVPWKPAPVLKEVLDNLEDESLALDSETLKQTLALDAEQFTLYADVLQEMAKESDKSEDLSKTAELMKTVSTNLTSVALPHTELKLSDTYLKATLKLMARSLKLKAALFENMADFAQTKRQLKTAYSMAARLHSIANIINNSLKEESTKNEEAQLNKEQKDICN